MDLLASVALLGWIPAGLLFVHLLGPRRGVIAIYVLGWLLLPERVGFKFVGLPDYGKVMAVSVAAALAVVLMDSRRITTYRPRLIDLPIVAFCLSPAASSLANELGAWDAFAAFGQRVLSWGFPYLIGRLYLRDQAALKDLAVGIVLGGLLYVPLCLFEIRMSPQLHTMVYGFHQHQFLQAKRYGGYRPTVFLQHGLAVGLFMSSATLTAAWLWRRKTVVSLLGMPMSWVVGTLAVVTILCKSVGSLGLLFVVAAALWIGRRLRTHLPIYALIAAIPIYIAARASGEWSGAGLVDTISQVMPDRALSLQARFDSEDVLRHKAALRPWFGWGGWGRNLVYEDQGFTVATDALWILVYGKYGVVGLITMAVTILLPVLRLLIRTPMAALRSAQMAPSLACGALVLMFGLDILVNAMPSPLYMLALSGIAAVDVNPRRRTRRARVLIRRPAPRQRPGSRRPRPSGARHA